MLLVIDNYDSFTYNLVHYLRQLSQEVQVYPHDKITIPQVLALKPSHIILSPGPGRPETAGIMVPLIHAAAAQIPILGVCLGHQAIASAFGGRIINAEKIMHGKTSLIHHQQQGIFSNVANPFVAMRYHSLVVDPKTLPEELTITAWTQNDAGNLVDIMAIQHQVYPVAGVQFHPESIASQAGHLLLKNFLQLFLMNQTYVAA